ESHLQEVPRWLLHRAFGFVIDLNWNASCFYTKGGRKRQVECPKMRHRRQMTNYRRHAGELVRKLPDGRHLVTALNQPTKVVDSEGNEIVPSPSEVIALKLISETPFPRKSWNEDRFAA